jgi:Uma2 family endonuclease
MASKPAEAFPWRPPFTVDLLFELPDTGLRYEVLGGSLVVSPQPSPRHNLAHDRLRAIFAATLPPDAESITTTAVRLPDGDGPVPDLLVTTAIVEDHPRWLPADLVHTVVEVVSPSNAATDRLVKTELYAEGGIPCYWRVELQKWADYRGPVPAIVARRCLPDGQWQEIIAGAGTLHELPVVVDANGTLLYVKVDPAELVGPRRG